MKRIYTRTLLIFLVFYSTKFSLLAQTPLEWRLGNVVYNSTDPDGAGQATGSVSFTLQIRTTVGTVTDISGISTGWSWQSTKAMLPTGLNIYCGVSAPPPGQPANVVMSTAFASAGFTYNNVNQCSGSVNFSVGGQTFDRRSAGTIDGGVINLTTTWVDVFTVTLWSITNTYPQAGYAVINSGSGGTNVPAGIVFGTYAVSDIPANEYPVNSLTYTAPLALGATTLPVLFTNYEVKCTDKGAALTWSTGTEINSSHFEIQKYVNGNWTPIGQVAAAGNSNETKTYQYLDLEGGAGQYRIRQVDLDGQSVYTAIRSVSCDNKGKVNVVIYPVPARDVLNVAIRTDKAIRTELQVFDMSGRIVKRQAASLTSGNNNLSINVNNLASGEYVIRSSDGSIQLNQKFTVMH